VHGGQPKPKVQVLAERLGLTSVLDAWPAEIPAGVQRKVEVARALARNPQVLLMDEPAAGLGDGDIEELITVIRGVSSSVLTILVEHNMQLIGDVADEVVVLIEGVVAIRDSPDVVARAAAVRQAYLGVG
jgi:ABC-type branched-subunit amino acid transport system ATPase component